MRKDEQNYCSFILNDIMGFEKNTCDGVHKKDIILALMGHMKEGYEFTPGKRLMENDRNYYSCPTPDDKVHVLVSVVPAGLVSILSDDIFKKMRDVRIAASEIGIPQIALLTKVDEACPKVRKDIKNTYKSKYLKEKSLFLKVLIFHKLLGIPLNCIFLVENYDSTFQINNDKNAQILCALRKMIELGEDYLNELE
ncbi:Interferon-induced protein 44-like [Channa argus]|uniref:Interferon-induced protein 44-like n=1 Tax=Channa argus TaxID=215402 RepID=A0A6G1QCL5_CHAAH|nr:Interferon-induced protein 44-like [Channa argus]